ncbi:MAG: hypothetical protein HY859_06940 [Caulobacterales bacterium]|nr:hypothetical protein [Caulobacterales bacterium]
MAESINERLLHHAVGHQVDLTRFSNSVIRRMIRLLNGADERLKVELIRALAESGMDATSFRVARLEAMLGSLRQINAAAYLKVGAALTDELRAFVDYEALYQIGLLENVLPGDVLARFPLARVSVPQVYVAAVSRPFQGRLLSEWAKNAEENRVRAVSEAVRQGYIEGRTTDEIVRSVMGTQAKRFTDGRIDRSRRGLATIIQSALAHTAATAREHVYSANSDIIKAERWVSVLDTGTTPECRIRDGKRYTADAAHKPIGHRVPWLQGPGRLHMCCRSTSSPVTKSYRELGLDIDEISPATRASMDGQVPADMTYGDWLAKQSATRQDEILGARRGKLFRDGGMPFDAMFTNRGDFLTLDELRARDAATFRRAGL